MKGSTSAAIGDPIQATESWEWKLWTRWMVPLVECPGGKVRSDYERDKPPAQESLVKPRGED
jgi:hypothetical protein